MVILFKPLVLLCATIVGYILLLILGFLAYRRTTNSSFAWVGGAFTLWAVFSYVVEYILQRGLANVASNPTTIVTWPFSFVAEGVISFGDLQMAFFFWRLILPCAIVVAIVIHKGLLPCRYKAPEPPAEDVKKQTDLPKKETPP